MVLVNVICKVQKKVIFLQCLHWLVIRFFFANLNKLCAHVRKIDLFVHYRWTVKVQIKFDCINALTLFGIDIFLWIIEHKKIT